VIATPEAPAIVRPTLMLVPDGSTALAREVIELAEMAGLVLDAWQRLVLTAALTQTLDGRWAAPEVGVVVSRQNGKGGILEARELGGLFLILEGLITHSAHQFDTSLEAFRRLLFLIENTPELSRRVARVSRSHGEEGIELIGGQRIRFRTRTKNAGRGFSGDCLVIDEAMIYAESAHGALLPTLSARRDPQVWLTGSAVDQTIHEHGLVLARMRERARREDARRLAFFEWGASVDLPDGEDREPNPDDVTPQLAASEQAWEQANPALDIRISRDAVAVELESLDPRTFAVERLGIGDWPDTSPAGERVIAADAWAALADPTSCIEGPVTIAVDTRPDRRSTTIAAAGRRPDGLMHVEVIERRAGTTWVADRVAELRSRHAVAVALADSIGPAASLAEDAGLELVQSTEHARSCGTFFDLVSEGLLRHLGTPELVNALAGAQKRPLGDAWAWSRRSSRVDISPLVAVTLAVGRAAGRGEISVYEAKDLLVV
jgi:hypothetical protein